LLIPVILDARITALKDDEWMPPPKWWLEAFQFGDPL